MFNQYIKKPKVVNSFFRLDLPARTTSLFSVRVQKHQAPLASTVHLFLSHLLVKKIWANNSINQVLSDFKDTYILHICLFYSLRKMDSG